MFSYILIQQNKKVHTIRRCYDRFASISIIPSGVRSFRNIPPPLDLFPRCTWEHIHTVCRFGMVVFCVTFHIHSHVERGSEGQLIAYFICAVCKCSNKCYSSNSNYNGFYSHLISFNSSVLWCSFLARYTKITKRKNNKALPI